MVKIAADFTFSSEASKLNSDLKKIQDSFLNISRASGVTGPMPFITSAIKDIARGKGSLEEYKTLLRSVAKGLPVTEEGKIVVPKFGKEFKEGSEEAKRFKSFILDLQSAFVKMGFSTKEASKLSKTFGSAIAQSGIHTKRMTNLNGNLTKSFEKSVPKIKGAIDKVVAAEKIRTDKAKKLAAEEKEVRKSISREYKVGLKVMTDAGKEKEAEDKARAVKAKQLYRTDADVRKVTIESKLAAERAAYKVNAKLNAKIKEGEKDLLAIQKRATKENIALNKKKAQSAAEAAKKQRASLSSVDKAYQRQRRNLYDVERSARSMQRAFMVVIGAFVGLIKVSSDFGLQLERLRLATGLTYKESAELIGLGEVFGIESKSVVKGIAAMQQALLTAGEGTSLVAERVREVYAKVGISAERFRGSHIGVVETLDLVRKAFREMKDPQDRMYLAQRALAGQSEAFLPILSLTDKAWNKLRADLGRFTSPSKKTIENLIEFRLRLIAVKLQLRTVGASLIADIVPAFTKLVEKIREATFFFKSFSEETRRRLTTVTLGFTVFGLAFSGIAIAFAPIFRLISGGLVSVAKKAIEAGATAVSMGTKIKMSLVGVGTALKGLLLNPLTWIAVAVGVLIAVFAKLWFQSRALKQEIKELRDETVKLGEELESLDTSHASEQLKNYIEWLKKAKTAEEGMRPGGSWEGSKFISDWQEFVQAYKKFELFIPIIGPIITDIKGWKAGSKEIENARKVLEDTIKAYEKVVQAAGVPPSTKALKFLDEGREKIVKLINALYKFEPKEAIKRIIAFNKGIKEIRAEGVKEALKGVNKAELDTAKVEWDLLKRSWRLAQTTTADKIKNINKFIKAKTGESDVFIALGKLAEDVGHKTEQDIIKTYEDLENKILDDYMPTIKKAEKEFAEYGLSEQEKKIDKIKKTSEEQIKNLEITLATLEGMQKKEAKKEEKIRVDYSKNIDAINFLIVKRQKSTAAKLLDVKYAQNEKELKLSKNEFKSKVRLLKIDKNILKNIEKHIEARKKKGLAYGDLTKKQVAQQLVIKKGLKEIAEMDIFDRLADLPKSFNDIFSGISSAVSSFVSSFIEEPGKIFKHWQKFGEDLYKMFVDLFTKKLIAEKMIKPFLDKIIPKDWKPGQKIDLSSLGTFLETVKSTIAGVMGPLSDVRLKFAEATMNPEEMRKAIIMKAMGGMLGGLDFGEVGRVTQNAINYTTNNITMAPDANGDYQRNKATEILNQSK